MESVYWLVLLAILLVIELCTLGLTTIWFAGGALAAAIAAFFGCGIVMQVIIFLVVSVVLLVFTRPLAMRYINNHRSKTNCEELIGKTIKITEKVDNFNQTGCAVVNGAEWTVRAEREADILEPGDRAVITGISGVKLIVKPCNENN